MSIAHRPLSGPALVSGGLVYLQTYVAPFTRMVPR